MVICTRLTVPIEEFALAEPLRRRPDIRLEFERVVPLRAAASFIWIACADAEWAAETVREDEAVAGVDVVEGIEDGVLLSVEWRPDAVPLLNAFADAGATCLKGVGTADGWQLTLRYPNREVFAESYRSCLNAGIDVNIESIHSTGHSVDHGVAAVLTEPQREALCEALGAGYFAVPRAVTLEELATRLGISDTAASQRVRRGVASILTETLE